MAHYTCMFCKHVYDEAEGDPAAGIAPGTLWEQTPEGWTCPRCRQPKSAFKRKN